MPMINTPTINNKAMAINDFIYSDGTYDYCIVNGESLTKYYDKEPDDYESYPIHKFSNPFQLLQRKDNLWLKTLLRYDYISESPKYTKHQELMENISKNIEIDLFGEPI